MIPISTVVKQIVNRNSQIQSMLADNLLSISRYAESIKEEVEREIQEEVTPSSIIMALRRYQKSLKKEINKIISLKYQMQVRTDVYSVNLSFSAARALVNFLSQDDYTYFNMSLGCKEISFSIDAQYKKELLQYLEKEQILKEEDNMVALTLLFDEKFMITYGVIFDIVRKLALNKININEVYSTYSELTFTLKAKDGMRAFALLQEINEA